MRASIFLLALFSLSCGARTDLDRPHAADAGARDGGYFFTFPCRWSYGLPFEIARGPSFTQLSGAVHATRDEVVVGAEDANTRAIVALLTLSQRPELLTVAKGARPGRLFTSADGYAQQIDRSCSLYRFDPDLSGGSVIYALPNESCAMDQSESGRVEILPLGRADGLFTLDLDADGAERVAGLSGDAIEGAAVRTVDSTFAVALAGDGAIMLGPPGALTGIGAGGRVSGAPDRLRGGAIFLYAGDLGVHHLVHLNKGREVNRVTDLSTLRAQVLGRVATNETEALLALRDGSLAFIPLNADLIRYAEGATEGAVSAIEIVLRPGQSAGGLLYVIREPAESRLMFRALVCNR